MKLNLIILLSLVLCTAQACATSPQTPTDEQQLRHLKTTLWQQAYRNGDVKLLDKILHESFQFVQNDGSISTKAKELDFVANNQWNPKSFRYEILRLDIYQGQFAVVSGTGHAETQNGTKYQYHSSNHLIKQDGRWQAISSHVSGYKELTD
ncbi:MAG: nuclear transport factor 2 family protein [Gammaproteobacteria bacterium]|nr:nuclear transport factor 2 family protein [Gammaproteobacteria bacterium]